MEPVIDIKALAKEIINEYPTSKILDGCSGLIGEYEADAQDYYSIEDGLDTHLGGYDWSVDICFTPSCSIEQYGGYVGCDYDEIERIVDEIEGIESLCVNSVFFYDEDGNEFSLTESQVEELDKELQEYYI